MKEINPETLVGQSFDFYGVDGNYFKLDEVIYEAVEDENDGYRSSLECLRIKDDDQGVIFFRTPVARVTLVEADDADSRWRGRFCFDGYKLVDESGHMWLLFGTDNYDDYYPSFTFEYNAKPA